MDSELLMYQQGEEGHLGIDLKEDQIFTLTNSYAIVPRWALAAVTLDKVTPLEPHVFKPLGPINSSTRGIR